MKEYPHLSAAVRWTVRIIFYAIVIVATYRQGFIAGRNAALDEIIKAVRYSESTSV